MYDCPHGLGMAQCCTVCLGKLPKARKGGGGGWWPGRDAAPSVVIGHNPIPASGRDLSRVIEREYAPTLDSQRFPSRGRTQQEYTDRPTKARFTRGAPRAHAIG